MTLDLAERQLHAERLAALEQAHDLSVGHALGLGVPVACERRDERPAPLEVQLADLVRAPQVHVDRALVDRRVGARRLGRAEQLPGGDVDDREGLGRRRAQRDRRRRVGAGPPGHVARAGDAVAPAQLARALEQLRRRLPARPEELAVLARQAAPRAPRTAGAGGRSTATRGRGSPPRRAGRGTRRDAGRRTGPARPRPPGTSRGRALAGPRAPTSGAATRRCRGR